MEMLVTAVTVFVLAVFIGFEIINKVPPTLHTPLMSGSNAISGITLIGALSSRPAPTTGWPPCWRWRRGLRHDQRRRRLPGHRTACWPCSRRRRGEA
jgi:hypothetical protein